MNAVEKKTMKRRLLTGLWAFLLGSWSLTPVYASDTEVYARLIEIDSADAAPTLMMMMDTSNFMNYCMTDANTTGSTCADPDQSRIAVLRRAMRKALYGNHDPAQGDIIKPAPGFLRLGYSRFMPSANDGGWVRYPAMKLDDLASAAAATTGFTNQVIDKRVEASANDAVCTMLAGLCTATNTTPGTAVLGKSNPTIAVRFTAIRIPKGATIDSATLSFTSASGSQSPDIFVAADDSDDSPDFSASGIQARTWTSESASLSGYSVSVKAQLQAIVDRAGWCGGNSISLRVRSDTSNKTRTVYLFDGTGSTTAEVAKRPRLQVTWSLTDTTKLQNSCNRVALDTVSLVDSVYDDIEWVDGSSAVTARNNTLKPAAIYSSKNNMVAARFKSLQIDKGANVVEYAYLFSTLSNGDADAVVPTIKVTGIKQPSVPKFCNNTATPVTCTVPDTSSMTTATSTFQMDHLLDASSNPIKSGVNFVADVTNQVKEIVAQGTWAKGNSMAFVMQNNGNTGTSQRGISAADEGLSKSMVLHVRGQVTVTDLTKLPKTVRQDIYEDINTQMIATGGTPIADGYQETARYILGSFWKTANHPKTGPTDTVLNVAGTNVTFKAPDLRTINGDYYKSTLDRTGKSCSATYIFAMSDGDPANASNVTTNSEDLLQTAQPQDKTLQKCGDGVTFSTSLNSTVKANYQCMGSVAKWLYKKDVRDPTKVSDYKPVIRTNTVLFNGQPDAQISAGLNTIAQAGGGKFYTATDEDEMLNALLDTLRSVIEKTGSITAPGVAVNQFNRLTHLDQLYYAVFDPDQGNAHWRGNVKRYRLNFTDTDAQIVDKNNNPAIDSDTFFSDEAWSFWSPEKDGKTTTKGGMASKLPAPASRNLYTYLSSPYSSNMSLTKVSIADASVVSSAKALMGLGTDNATKNVLNWLLGYDINVQDPASSSAAPTVNTNLVSLTGVSGRTYVGGVLHSQPILVNFGYDTSYTADQAATNADLQKNYLFFSTMEGELHAVDVKSTSGAELWSFIPKEVVAVADDMALNAPRDLPLFGLDLTWTALRVDGNKDLQITGAGNSGDDDKVWIYGGMRMGGRNYYALNVTNMSAPKLKWVIEGGSAGAFAKMGQTWSRPVIGDVKINGVVKTVLFFAGGYDTKHEQAGYTAANASDTYGNQIYVVDPDTGSVIFWASGSGSGANLESADMKYSIPSEVKTFDANKDGLVDAVYVGDLGGQMLRLDINNATTTNAGLGKRVKVLATIGQDVTADTTNQRRFYEAPSVAVMQDPATQQNFVGVVLGTGYRSHPLDETTQDAFYFFRDNDVLRADLMTATDLQTTITPSDLAVAAPSVATGVNMTGKRGWMMNFPDSGEKSLAAPILLFGEAFFTSYVPRQALATSKCSPVIGVTKLWRMSAWDASVIKDLNGDGVIDENDRYKDNLVEGLGGAPQLLVGQDGKNAIIAGTGVERNQDLSNANMRRTRWYEKSKR